MLRLVLLTVMALSLAVGAAKAEVIYIEDFTEDGEPGFDPMFTHNLSGDNGQDPNWMFWFGDLLLMSRTTDKITFNLEAGQSVSYASLDVTGGGAEVRFVGVDWELNFSNDDVSGIVIYEATRDEIGAIVAVELCSWEGRFDNATIQVVPEPSVTTAFIIMCVIGCMARAYKWRR